MEGRLVIKEIDVRDVRIGMYIVKVNCPWLKNPFWRKEFLLNSERHLRLIQASTAKSVWIDCSKGIEPQAVLAVVTPLDTSEDAVQEAAAESAQVCSSLQDEMQHAAAIIERAHSAVQDMFHDIRMGKAINIDAAEDIAQEISDSVARNSYALISLARLKKADRYTYLHSVAVCALMSALARQLDLSDLQIRQASLAGLLHDVGKAEIPLEILNKPERLTADEFKIIMQHPRQGYELLLEAGVTDEVVLDVCLHHHEKLNGRGYPDGCDSEHISLMAKMGAICDIYDAITSNRPYKAGWDPAESIKRMYNWCGEHLDTQVFHAFVRTLGIYPIGSLVRLNNGMLGVVTEQNHTTLLHPKVKAFFSINTLQYCKPELFDLSEPSCTCSIVQREDPVAWKLGDWSHIWAETQEPA